MGKYAKNQARGVTKVTGQAIASVKVITNASV